MMGPTRSLFRPSSVVLAATAFVMLSAGAALAEVGAGDAASAGLPGCVDPDLFPDQATTPCSAILVFQPGAKASDRVAVVRGAGAALGHDLARYNAASAFVPNDAALWALADDPDIARIIPNRRVHVMGPPGACSPWPSCKNGDGGDGDPGGNQETPSGVTLIGADVATGTGDGVGVAIVDTGLDYGHGDLDVVNGDPCFDAFGGDCQDDHGHGTHVGGIVAALDNDQDVVGVAPGAALYGVKVLDSTGFGSDADVIEGLTWVLDNANTVSPPIGVVNMSLGDEPRNCGAADWTPPPEGQADPHPNPPDNPVLRQVIQDLTAADITVVVAAGNDRTLEVKDTVPAGCAEVIAVASTTAVDGKNKCKFIPDPIFADTASFFTTDGAFSDVQPSGKGIGVTISAPGEKQEDLTCGTVQSEGILSLLLGGGTTRKSGTSMASPHVAGVVALMLEADGMLMPEAVRADLRANADLVGIAPLDPILGTPDGELEGILSAAGL